MRPFASITRPADCAGKCVRRGDCGDGLPGDRDIALSNALGRDYIAAANDDIEHAPSQGLHGFTWRRVLAPSTTSVRKPVQ